MKLQQILTAFAVIGLVTAAMPAANAQAPAKPAAGGEVWDDTNGPKFCHAKFNGTPQEAKCVANHKKIDGKPIGKQALKVLSAQAPAK